jgi:hypothetical protein
MSPAGAARFCSCGTRLASDNRTSRCGACRRKDRDRFLRPPAVPGTFWDHAEMQAALASRHFGRILRAYRAHPFHGSRPLAQGVVAHWLRLTQSQLSRIENGRPVQDLDRLIHWACLLDIPEHLLWFRLPDRDRAVTSEGARPVPPRLPAAHLPRLPRHLVPVVRLDDLAALRSLRAADRQVGGGYLYATVASYLRHRIAPRLFGGSWETDEHRIFIAAAGLTEMAGWMAHDAGRDALAEQHFHRALDMARIGRDHQLGAHVLSSLSHLAHHHRQPRKAIEYARDGHAQLAAGKPHPGVEARLLAMQARGHAALRNQDRCTEQLHQAERVLARTLTDEPSPWVSSFDQASLATEAARCFQQLGQFTAARSQAGQVVELRPRDRARSRAFAQLMLISILIAEGTPDEACGVAYEVLDATRALGSYLVVQQLEELDRLLTPYRRNRDIAEFLGHLTEELRERRWLTQWLPAAEPPGQAEYK